ncbi:hypothetical protein CWI36_0508p0020 [Hamiltosporidium magnivora]|uniref:Uncharacterized protein n=1 Tax=Hamiltosporidium magnivora TaxID=148818 RepID=A0A4Q9LDS3_9MICR|nr:hypothetical protein CWI36_0508p0020 [Hamiltosporidium magnivora]
MISSKNISEENTNDKNIEDLYAKVIRRKKPKNTSIQETILMVECKPNEILNETTTSDQLSTIHQENQSNEITNVEPSNTIYQEISLNEITNIDKLNRMYQDSQPNVIPTANILYNSRKNEILSVGDTSGWPKKSNIGSYDETVFCYNQHTNVFRELENVEPRINTNEKTDSEEEQMMVVPMEEIISVFFEEKGAYLFKFDRKNDVLDQCKRNLQYAGKDCFS